MRVLASVAASPAEAALYVVRAKLARGDILLLDRRYQEARRAYEEARAVADKLTEEAPGHWEARWSQCLAGRSSRWHRLRFPWWTPPARATPSAEAL